MNSAGYLINHAARLFARGLRDQIAPSGLAPAQFMALLELWNDDGLMQKELVERLDVEQATIANTITRMERDGLIERKRLPEDKRARLFYLKDNAGLPEGEAKNSAESVNNKFLRSLSIEEQTQFIGDMQRMIGDMKATESLSLEQ